MPASDKRPTAPKPAWSMPAPCARSSARPRRRCSSRKATSTTAPRNARRASPARCRATSIRAIPIRPLGMFEQRMAALEGAEAARSTATGMAAVTTALMGLVKAGDHVVAAKALFGSCRWVIEEWLPRFGVASTLVDGTDLDAMAKRGAQEHQGVLHGNADQSDAGGDRHRGGRRHRAQGRRQAGGRQRVRHAALPEPARARRRLRGLFGDQAHRRPGPRARRRHPGVGEIHHGPRAPAHPPDRAVAVAVQRLGAAERAWRRLSVRVQRQTDTAATVSVALVDHPRFRG